MLGQEAHGIGRPSHSPGVFQSCIAAAVVSGCTYAITYFCQHYLGAKPPDWALGVVPPLVGGVVVFGVWQIARIVFRRRQQVRGRVEAAKGDRIAIYVADLKGDNPQRAGYAGVVDSIVREIGRDTVEVLPAGIELALSENTSTDHAADAANTEARRLLHRKPGDLLIWGCVHQIGHESVLEFALFPPTRRVRKDSVLVSTGSCY